MLISLEGTGTLHQRIYRSVRKLIVSGAWPGGARLPVSRQLAADLRVSRNVVLLAYEELIAEGYAVGHVGSGTYVSAVLPDARIRTPVPMVARPSGRREETASSKQPPLSKYARRLMAHTSPAWIGSTTPNLKYDFDYGLASPEDFPQHIWEKLAVRHVKSTSLDYLGPQGDQQLRAGLTTYLRNHRGVECEADQILIVNGAQQAFDLTARVMIDPGDSVAIEDPHHHRFRETYIAAGARIQTISVDGDGIMVPQLRRLRARMRFVHVTPSHQFPSGAILSLPRRLELLAWAARTGTYIVEDDYDSEFRYDSRPIEALQAIDGDQRVIYVGTFSRSMFPALRLGYMVLPKSLVPVFTQAKRLTDRYSAPWPQQVMAEFIQGGYMERHLRKCRARKAVLRSVLLEALAQHFGETIQITGASSGEHVMVRLLHYSPEQLERLIAAAARAGVGIYSARPYYLKPPEVSELVIGYGAMSEHQIRTGIRIVASLI